MQTTDLHSNTSVTLETLKKRPLSFTSLKAFIESPKKFLYYHNNLLERGKSDEFSKAFHVLLLEGEEEFNKEYFVFDPDKRPNKDKNFTNKENREWKKKEIEKNNGKFEVDKKVLYIYNNIKGTAIHDFICKDTTLTEQTKTVEIHGLPFVCKPDIYDPISRTLIDLKHIGVCSDKNAKMFIEKHLTYLQLYIYSKAFPADNFAVFSYNAKPPFNWNVNYLNEQYYYLAELELESICNKFKKCLEDGTFSNKKQFDGEDIFPSPKMLYKLEQLERESIEKENNF